MHDISSSQPITSNRHFDTHFTSAMCVFERVKYTCGHFTNHMKHKCQRKVLHPTSTCKEKYQPILWDDLCPNCFAQREAAFERARTREHTVQLPEEDDTDGGLAGSDQPPVEAARTSKKRKCEIL